MSDDRTVEMNPPDPSPKSAKAQEKTVVDDGQRGRPRHTSPLREQGRAAWEDDSALARPTTPLVNREATGARKDPGPVFAWLVVVDGPDASSIGRVHTLEPDTTTLGRVPGNHIELHDETISAQHAVIQREIKERQQPFFSLVDLGSRNGIYAGPRESFTNEQGRVYRHELKDGDYVLLGETTLVFKRL